MNNRNTHSLKRAALWLVALHFLAVVLHSAAHEALRGRATPAQLAFIVPVIILAPVAAGFMPPRRERGASALLLASMAGSFFLGLYYHFVADTIDRGSHVARLGPASWSRTFRATA